MEWTTVVLIAIAVASGLVTLSIIATVIVARSGRRWYEREKEEMDREHEEWKRRHGFGGSGARPGRRRR